MKATPVAAPSTSTAGRWAVVGGGVSGMAAAWFLTRAGYRAEILERDDRLGGRSQSGVLEGKEITFGGKNIGRRYELFRDFAASLGDHRFEPFGINSSRAHGGRLRTYDSSRRVRGALALAGRMTPRDAIRFARLARRVNSSDDARFLGSPQFAELGRRHDDRPLNAYFSERFTDAVVRPMTVRMNGAEPDEAYLGNFGSNLGMLLDSYDQLTRGIGPLVEEFERAHSVRTGIRVESLVVRDGRVAGVCAASAGGATETLDYDGVVVAAPARAAAGLVADADPALASDLARVRYFPAAVVVAAYDHPVFTPAVRGVVFGTGEPVSNAGAYGVSDLDVVRYTFSGRAARGELAAGADPEALLELAEAQLGRYLPVAAARRRDFVHRSWRHGYCAYLPRYADFLDGVLARVGGIPGLELTGDYLRGASIEACFRAARDCVERVAAADGRERAGARTVDRAG